MKNCTRWLLILFLSGLTPSLHAALDKNTNGFDDIWELYYGVGALSPNGDADGDGFSNAQESTAGTDPFDPNSHPQFGMTQQFPGWVRFDWSSIPGKNYLLLARTNVGSGIWTTNIALLADGFAATTNLPMTNAMQFFKLLTTDKDSDGDGLSDAEEHWLGFNPASAHTDRQDTPDFNRVTNMLTTASVVTVSALDPMMSERWPDPGLVSVRRKGGVKPITVNIAFGGTATKGVDYTTTVSSNILIPLGVREVWIQLNPVADTNDVEPTETITVTALAGTGYTVGPSNVATLTLENETATSGPSAKAAARFLFQAAFGPDQAQPGDSNNIPQNVRDVMSLGFSGWIDDQFNRPIGHIQPYVEWANLNANQLELYGNWKEFAWWGRAMGSAKLRPDDATNMPPDFLRQRVAFALSEILVASDRPEQLATEQIGMANYYDLMEQYAFGNYRDLLYAVTMHPVMGIYLSDLGNRKADPVNKIYPDENYAREIMQLFSIGLWKLNPDGTRQTDTNGQFIATYNNSDITELARVFTGLSFGNNVNFTMDPRDYTIPMKIWDAEHDCNAKTLIGGLALPARTPSPGNTGTAGLADVNAAVSNLFMHQSIGPFIGKQLIQRLVTSNPSTGYVARVSAAFADNGGGVRGDLRAVVKAILLDPEARDPQMMSQPTWGKLREPLLRVVNYAHAIGASSPSGMYPLDQFTLDHMQDPMNAPSVFNFFLPSHSPPGPITQLGLVAPEFQILNAGSAITGPDYFWNSIVQDLHHYGNAHPDFQVKLNLTNELAFIVPAAQITNHTPTGPVGDTDTLLRRLDFSLTGGTLSPQQFQIIREAMERIGTSGYDWHISRVRLAIYLIVTSSDFNVLR